MPATQNTGEIKNMSEPSAEMDVKELYRIATAVLDNKIKETPKTIERLRNLKETGYLDRKLVNIYKALQPALIKPEAIRNFAATILAPYAPEIFGKPGKEMSEEEIGEISYEILLSYAEREGIRILPKNQARRRLGNISASTGIKIERLETFANIFLKMAINQIYPGRSNKMR